MNISIEFLAIAIPITILIVGFIWYHYSKKYHKRRLTKENDKGRKYIRTNEGVGNQNSNIGGSVRVPKQTIQHVEIDQSSGKSSSSIGSNDSNPRTNPRTKHINPFTRR